MPYDAQVHAALKSGRQMTGMWTSWEYAMRDADTMARWYHARVRVGKLERPFMGASWYCLQLP